MSDAAQEDRARQDGQRRMLIRLGDWLYGDSDGGEEVPIEQVEAELREAGIDMEQAKVRMREMISRLSRQPRESDS